MESVFDLGVTTMTVKSSIVLSCIAAFASACSVYPLPQDVSGVTTKSIVQKMRCEARDALRRAAIRHLRSLTDGKPVAWGLTGPALADDLESHPNNFLKLKIATLRGKAQDDFKYYANSQVAYDFTLRGLESNTQGLDVAADQLFLRRVNSVGFKAEGLRERDVSRSFILVDGFETLTTEVGDTYCNEVRGIDLIYPMAGSAPLDDLVETYVYTNAFAEFGTKDSKPVGIKGTDALPAVPQMADTIIFKTRLTGNIDPGVAFNPVGPGLFLSSIAFRNDNYREDNHKVIVTLTTAPVTTLKGRTLAGLPLTRAPGQALRLETGVGSITFQRNKNYQDNIGRIGDGISRLSR